MDRLVCVSLLIATSCLTLIPTMTGYAGSLRDRAVAAVAVARTAVEISDERPLLPDSKHDQFRSNAVIDKVSGVIKSQNQLLQDAVVAGTDAQTHFATNVAFEPMHIELAKSVVITDVLPAQLIIGKWERGCSACNRLEREIKSTLTPLGWSIGNDPSSQIQFVDVPHTESVPQITLYQNASVIQRWDTYTDPGFLSRELRKAWDEAPPIRERSATSPAVAGKIHAQSNIRSILTWWREQIGERIEATMAWDRTGAQTFPLLAGGDWSSVALFGRSGRFELSASGALRLPIERLGFAYRIAGDDFVFDLDPITMQGLAQKLGPQMPASEPMPSRFDPMTAWTVLTVLRDLWSMLHPTCDLQLGGNVSATAVLDGDSLAVDFQQCPSIKIVALFTFQLKVNRVEISESNVRVLFGGSRLIKERTFQVK